jgi:hypothetical protein
VIYFLQEVREGGLIKIGSVKSELERRISRMQTGNPAYLKLLGVIPEGTRRDEHILHKRFKHARSSIAGRGTKRITFRGEWFEPVEELMNYIASLPPFPRPGTPLPARRLRGS